MAFFTYITKNKWITHTLITILIGSFILSQSQGLIDYFTKPDTKQSHILTINGKKALIHEYQGRFLQAKRLAGYQGYKKKDLEKIAHKNTKRYFLEKDMYTQTYDQLGLKLGEEELITILEEGRDMSWIADNPNFQDEKGNFSKSKWLDSVTSMSKQEKREFVKNILLNGIRQKLTYLVKSTTHTPRLEAAQDPTSKKLNIRYLFIPYTSTSYEGSITKEEKKAYLESYPKKHKLPESRTIAYIQLNIIPSSQDKELLKEELKDLLIAFQETRSTEDFAKSHTDNHTKNAVITCTKTTMPPLLVSKIPLLESGKVVKIQSEKGYILYKIISSKTGAKNIKNYKIARIYKYLKASEYTYEEHLKKAKDFKQIKSFDAWEKKAKKLGVKVSSLTVTKRHLEETLGSRSALRDMIRWAWNRSTKVNTVSDPIETKNNKYIVCFMKEKHQEGTAPLEEIDYKVEAEIRKDKIAVKITKKLKKLTAKKRPLEEIAQLLGSSIKVYTLKGLSFEQNDLPHTGYAPKAIGSAFGLRIGERTNIIIDQSGIFIIERLPNDQGTRNSITIISKQQKKNTARAQSLALHHLNELLYKINNVQDDTHLFY